MVPITSKPIAGLAHKRIFLLKGICYTSSEAQPVQSIERCMYGYDFKADNLALDNNLELCHREYYCSSSWHSLAACSFTSMAA